MSVIIVRLNTPPFRVKRGSGRYMEPTGGSGDLMVTQTRVHSIEGSLPLVPCELVAVVLQVSPINRVELEIKIWGVAFEPVDYARKRERVGTHRCASRRQRDSEIRIEMLYLG